MSSLPPGTYLVVSDSPHPFPLTEASEVEFDSMGANDLHYLQWNVFCLLSQENDHGYPLHTIVWQEYAAVAVGPIPVLTNSTKKLLRQFTYTAGVSPAQCFYADIW